MLCIIPESFARLSSRNGVLSKKRKSAVGSGAFAYNDRRLTFDHRARMAKGSIAYRAQESRQ
jgi:hypothetical protein